MGFATLRLSVSQFKGQEHRGACATPGRLGRNTVHDELASPGIAGVDSWPLTVGFLHQMYEYPLGLEYHHPNPQNQGDLRLDRRGC